jgi:hypothetical protein
LPAGSTRAGQRRWSWLGLAAFIAGATAAQGAEQAAPLEFRAQGSFPVQYVETDTRKSHQSQVSIAPYLDLSATAQLQPGLQASVFANGGHDRLGSFRDNDNTFLSFGGSTEKNWGAFSVGTSAEHTQYYTGTFGRASNIANDLNVFAKLRWTPNPNLKITPHLTATMRLDDGLAVQRYTYSFRVAIEQKLFDRWWFVATPRIRYIDYAGSEAGRRDTALGVAAGLKYAINDSVGITLLAAVEDRKSNVASKSSDKFAAGASIDFDIDFVRPRWPSGR